MTEHVYSNNLNRHKLKKKVPYDDYYLTYVFAKAYHSKGCYGLENVEAVRESLREYFATKGINRFSNNRKNRLIREIINKIPISPPHPHSQSKDIFWSHFLGGDFVDSYQRGYPNVKT